MKKNIKQLPLYVQMKNTSKEMQKAEVSLQHMQLGPAGTLLPWSVAWLQQSCDQEANSLSLKTEANKAPGSSLPSLLYLDGGLLTLGNHLVPFEAGSDLK